MSSMLLALFLAAAPAQPAAPASPPPKEAAIPFVSHDGIQDFRADGDKGVYIRGSNGAWYYATTMGSCPRLRDATVLGFETRGIDQLDRFGAIRAEGWRCPLKSVVRSAPPPKKAKKSG